VSTTSAVLDDDQGVDTLKQDRVHVNKIGCDDAAGLGGQELLPGRALAPGSRVNPGIDQPGQCRQPEPVGWLIADPATAPTSGPASVSPRQQPRPASRTEPDQNLVNYVSTTLLNNVTADTPGCIA
jgi:hypothetical protein